MPHSSPAGLSSRRLGSNPSSNGPVPPKLRGSPFLSSSHLELGHAGMGMDQPSSYSPRRGSAPLLDLSHYPGAVAAGMGGRRSEPWIDFGEGVTPPALDDSGLPVVSSGKSNARRYGGGGGGGRAHEAQGSPLTRRGPYTIVMPNAHQPHLAHGPPYHPRLYPSHSTSSSSSSSSSYSSSYASSSSSFSSSSSLASSPSSSSSKLPPYATSSYASSARTSMSSLNVIKSPMPSRHPAYEVQDDEDDDTAALVFASDSEEEEEGDEDDEEEGRDGRSSRRARRRPRGQSTPSLGKTANMNAAYFPVVPPPSSYAGHGGAGGFR